MSIKEFIKKSRLKPFDGIIVVVLILLSFVPLIIFMKQQADQVKPGQNVTYEAKLSVDGQEIKSFDLVDGQKKYSYLYEDEDGDTNLIVVDGRKIRITEANCGDQICVQRGWIDKAGETIVCLPHKLIIEISASDGNQEGNVIY